MWRSVRMAAVAAIAFAFILAANNSPSRADTIIALPDSGTITVGGVTPGEQVTVTLTPIYSTPIIPSDCIPVEVGATCVVEEGVFLNAYAFVGVTAAFFGDVTLVACQAFGGPCFGAMNDPFVTNITADAFSFDYSSGVGCPPFPGPAREAPACQAVEGYTITIDLPDGAYITPLPAALPLFATGLGVMGLLGWRRKWKNAAAIAAA